MTDEEKRIAIAKACPSVARIDAAGVPVWLEDSRKEFDPLTDLNAMHEAENCFQSEHEQNVYGDDLRLVMARGKEWRTWRATAAQRADAFLITKGLLK